MLPMIAEVCWTISGGRIVFRHHGRFWCLPLRYLRSDLPRRVRPWIPQEADHPDQGIYGAFRHRRGLAMLAKVGKFITDRKPDAKVGFNHMGTARRPEPLPPGISCLTLDFATATPQSRQASLCSALVRRPRPADIMNTVFNQGWGDSVPASLYPRWNRKPWPCAGARLPALCRRPALSGQPPRSYFRPRHPLHGGRCLPRGGPVSAAGATLVPDALLLHGPGGGVRRGHEPVRRGPLRA